MKLILVKKKNNYLGADFPATKSSHWHEKQTVLGLENIFWVSLIQNQKEVHMFHLMREVGEILEMFLLLICSC